MTLVQTELKSMKIWQTSRLPAEYQEVEYIQSSGGQYIDTGYKGNQNTAFEVKFRITGSNAENQERLGGDLGNNTSNSLTVAIRTDSLGTNNRFGGATLLLYGSDTAIGTDYTVYTDKDKYTLNGTQKARSGTVGTFTTENNMWLLQVKNKNGAEGFIGRMYYAKISESGTLVRNFVPCYRKADDVIGLYDLVNDVFYTNSGTGTFTKGNDTDVPAEKEIKRVTIRPNGQEKQIRPVGGLPYDNVYITTSGIYTGTDASPLTTQIKAATIYGAWYDREQNVIWMYTNNGIGWYDFDSDAITIVDSYAPSGIGQAMAFYGDYIVAKCGESYIAVMDRATKTKTRTINIPSGNYTSVALPTPYDQTCKYAILGQGYANKYVYDITTGTQGSNWGSSYFQVRCFNDKVIKSSENSSFSGINISDAPNGASSVTVSSGTYTNHWSTPTDSGLVSKVTSSDMEYNAYCMGCSRSTTNTQLLNVSTKTTTTLSTGNKSVCGALYKYNSQYAIAIGYGNNNGGTDRLWKIDKNNNTPTEITTGNGAMINILSSGNITACKKGIIKLDGTTVYSNSNFITAFSKDVYNG